MGLDNVYEAVRIKIYRKPFGASHTHYKLQAILAPYWIKDRAELPRFFRHIANTNFTMGRYDWGFKWESLGFSRHKHVEDLNAGAT